MKDYSYIIFDLDGTLTNPYEGILNSLRFALKSMNYPELPVSVPDYFIGPPVQTGFKNIYGFTPCEAEIAVGYFREYYGSKGLYENYPYEGMHELLETLHQNGKKIFVATLKLEKFAFQVLEHFNLSIYIDDIAGVDNGGNKTKSGLINELIAKYRLNPDLTVMIGDTHFDLVGAQESGIDAIALGYGFGKKQELIKHPHVAYAESVQELSELLF